MSTVDDTSDASGKESVIILAQVQAMHIKGEDLLHPIYKILDFL
jgi:hypothetical protein